MVVHHVRKPTNFLFNFLSGGCCRKYLGIAVFVQEVDNLFVSCNGGTHVDTGKTLCPPLNNNSPHINHCWESLVWLSSCSLLKRVSAPKS
jgi:hypothetical protein